MVLVDGNHLRPFVESYAEMYSAVLSCLQTQYIEHPVLDDILGSPVKAFGGVRKIVCLFLWVIMN